MKKGLSGAKSKTLAWTLAAAMVFAGMTGAIQVNAAAGDETTEEETNVVYTLTVRDNADESVITGAAVTFSVSYQDAEGNDASAEELSASAVTDEESGEETGDYAIDLSAYFIGESTSVTIIYTVEADGYNTVTSEEIEVTADETEQSGTVNLERTGVYYSVAVLYDEDYEEAQGSAVVCNEDGNAVEKIEEGKSATVTITPEDGYTIGEISIKGADDEEGTDLDASELTDNEDGTYSFAIEEITEDTEITIAFTEIAEPESEFESLLSYGDDSNLLRAGSEGNTAYYVFKNGTAVTLSVPTVDDYAFSGIKITGSDGSYGSKSSESYTFESTETITNVQLYYRYSAFFGGIYQWYSVDLGSDEVALVIDEDAPELSVSGITDGSVYNDSVTVSYTAEDAETYYSGMDTVEYTVTCDDEVTQSGTLYSYSGDDAAEQSVDGSFAVDAEANNSDDVKVAITAADRAGNTTTETYTVDFDTTVPEIAVAYDNNNAVNGSYFKEERTATITITERDSHFDPDNVQIEITAVDADGNDVAFDAGELDWTTVESDDDDNGDDAVHTAAITFNEEANYTFEVSCTDTAGNAAEGFSDSFCIDKTDPTGEIEAESTDGSLKSWDQLLSERTFGFWSKETITVSISGKDATAGVDTIEYYKAAGSAAESVLTESQLDAVTWTDFTSLSASSDQQFVIYAKITDMAGNKTYISTDGLIVDSTRPEETVAPTVTASPEQPINGIYSDDVKVKVTVKDPTSGGTYSGLAEVTYEIIDKDTGATETGTLYEFTKKNPTKSDLKQSYSGTITVDSDTFNSNNVVVKVYAKDNAGNQREAKTTLQIDTTRPTITVKYNNNDAENGKYFSKNRKATITITERNFDPDDVSVTIKNSDGTVPKVSSWKKKSNGSGNGDDTTWTATVTYKAEGDYTFKISCKDEAGNKSKKVDYGDSTAPTSFTIDKTLPKITVSYNNNTATNGTYFNASRTLTITIVEHNFSKSLVNITQTAQIDGAAISEPTVRWSSSGDTHTATIVYSTDGDYTFDIDMTDKAGNANAGVNYGSSVAYNAFTIDATCAAPIITGVENGAAYGEEDDVIPGFSYEDVNYDSYEITLLRTRKDEIGLDVTAEYMPEAYINEEGQLVSGTFDTFDKIRENDGIYTLTVTCTDKAGNQESETVTFTVNRFGSVYVYSDDLVALIDDGGQYVTAVSGQDLRITEYNPDNLKTLSIDVTQDGKPISDAMDYVEIAPVINDAVETGSSGWYQYEYTIDNELFAEDGIYKITVQSNDGTGNNNISTGSDYDEIQFYVDSTPPVFSAITGLEASSVNAETLEVKYTVSDAIALSAITVKVDGETVDEVTEAQIDSADNAYNLNDYTGSFTIGEKNTKQSVEIIVTDKAGNATSTADEGVIETLAEATSNDINASVTVSTKWWVRWMANRALFIGSIVAAAAVVAVILILVALKRRKKEEEEKEA